MSVFVWFGSSLAAKRAAIIFGVLTFAALITAGSFWVRDLQIRRNYQLVTAVVTDNFISQDRRTSWSDTEFQLEGQIHTIRHDFFWLRGREIELFVNTQNPQRAIPVRTIGTSVSMALLSAGMLGLFFLLYLLNFIFNRRRDRKQNV